MGSRDEQKASDDRSAYCAYLLSADGTLYLLSAGNATPISIRILEDLRDSTLAGETS